MVMEIFYPVMAAVEAASSVEPLKLRVGLSFSEGAASAAAIAGENISINMQNYLKRSICYLDKDYFHDKLAKIQLFTAKFFKN